MLHLEDGTFRSDPADGSSLGPISGFGICMQCDPKFCVILGQTVIRPEFANLESFLFSVFDRCITDSSTYDRSAVRKNLSDPSKIEQTAVLISGDNSKGISAVELGLREVRS